MCVISLTLCMRISIGMTLITVSHGCCKRVSILEIWTVHGQELFHACECVTGRRIILCGKLPMLILHTHKFSFFVLHVY